ncbi:MAG: DUF975 family protein [Erysipelotrichaceae bacterium]
MNMKIKQFKALGFMMMSKSFLTTLFITTMTILLKNLAQIDMSGFITPELLDAQKVTLFDELLSALQNGVNNNVLAGILGTNAQNIGDLLSLALFAAFFFIVIYSVFEVGRDRYLLEVRKDILHSNLVFFGYNKAYYRKIVYAQLLRYGKILLATLCFIVPGIFYYYKYRYLNYVICDDSEASIHDWFERNNALTDGRIWHLFLIDLSFIGWRLINLFTWGLFKFFLEPYYVCTMVEVYCASKEAYDKYHAKEVVREKRQRRRAKTQPVTT